MSDEPHSVAEAMTRDEAVAILRSPEGRDETRRVYHLRRAFELVMQTIYGGDHSRSEAEQLVEGLADLAEEFFPEAPRPSPSSTAVASAA